MKSLMLLISLVILTSCSPRYKVKTHYKQPKTQKGKSCLKSCQHKKYVCQTNCNRKHSNCLEDARMDAKDSYDELSYEYDMEMRDYYHDMDRYRFSLDRWESGRNRLRADYREASRDCARIKSAKFKKNESKKSKKRRRDRLCKKSRQTEKALHHHIYDLKPTQPHRPIKPTFSNQLTKFQKRCSQQCGCTKLYDSCFVSCGGTLSYQKICIENCE